MTEKTFIENVTEYCDIDAEIKRLTKEKDRLKDSITAYMDEHDLDSQTVEDWRLVKSVSQRTTVNEDKMLSIVKGWGVDSDELVKSKEYVDTDVLEDLTYKGVISPTQLKELDTCRTVKEVVSLRPSPRKGG